MNSEILGELIKDPEIAAWRKSKNVISKNKIPTPFFDLQEIQYRIEFDDNEDLAIATVDLVLGQFFNFQPILKKEVAKKAFNNWQEFNHAVGCLDGIETYRSVKDRPDWMERSLQNCLWLEKLTESEKVWNYISPIEIIVTKDRYKKRAGVFIQILCNCDWEEEHGLQIVLENGDKLIRVSDQDGQLFQYDN
jgi:hypothetical protein